MICFVFRNYLAGLSFLFSSKLLQNHFRALKPILPVRILILTTSPWLHYLKSFRGIHLKWCTHQHIINAIVVYHNVICILEVFYAKQLDSLWSKGCTAWLYSLLVKHGSDVCCYCHLLLSNRVKSPTRELIEVDPCINDLFKDNPLHSAPQSNMIWSFSGSFALMTGWWGKYHFFCLSSSSNGITSAYSSQ